MADSDLAWTVRVLFLIYGDGYYKGLDDGRLYFTLV